MTKLEFLAELERRCGALSKKDISKAVDYYSEMLDDYAEDGLDTDAAIAKMGGIEKIVLDIISEAEGQICEENPQKLNTGTHLWLHFALKLAECCAVFGGIFVCGLTCLCCVLGALGMLVDALFCLFSGTVIFGIFTFGAALMLGALGTLAGVGTACLIGYLRKRKNG